MESLTLISEAPAVQPAKEIAEVPFPMNLEGDWSREKMDLELEEMMEGYFYKLAYEFYLGIGKDYYLCRQN